MFPVLTLLLSNTVIAFVTLVVCSLIWVWVDLMSSLTALATAIVESSVVTADLGYWPTTGFSLTRPLFKAFCVFESPIVVAWINSAILVVPGFTTIVFVIVVVQP